MPHRLKQTISLILLFVLAFGAMGLSASAEGEIRIAAGDGCYGMVVYRFLNYVTDLDFAQAEGSFIPGLTYDYNGNCIFVTGVPTAAGTYSLSGTASTVDSETEFWSFTITVEGQLAEEHYPPKITKQPTDETAVEGGGATFISRADNAVTVSWLLIDPNTYTSYSLNDSLDYFGDLGVSGENSDTLMMYNIPLDLNEWLVRCRFENMYGTSLSDTAKLTVRQASLLPPVISSQPNGFSTSIGQSGTLTVLASDPNSATLNYQWYESPTGGNDFSPVAGANSPSYAPKQTVGTRYYAVEVWSSDGSLESPKLMSSPAAVTFVEASVPSPTQSPVPVVSVSPSPTLTQKPDSSELKRNIATILIVTVLLLGGIAAAIILIYRKNAPAQEAEPKKAEEKPTPHERVSAPAKRPRASKEWLCTCGALNNGFYCIECGKPKPDPVLCGKCGWLCPDANRLPNYCPQCGAPFGIEKKGEKQKTE